MCSLELASARWTLLLFAVTFAVVCTMVDLQTEALIAIAVIGIALVSFGLYPIAKLALSQRKPRAARVSATSEERDGLVTYAPICTPLPKFWL